MRLAPLLALPPIAFGIAAAVWMIASEHGPAQVEGEAPALPVRVLTVAEEDIRPTASAWGNLRAAETWVAVAEVQGEVIWRHPDLEPGRLIPAETEVLRIDPTDYELALTQSRADLAALAAEAAQLTAEAANTGRILDLERARLALAEADLTRTRTLAEQGTVPQSRADEAERATLLARRTVAELENTLALIPPREARITAQVAWSEAAIARAQRSLAHATLAAPSAFSARPGPAAATAGRFFRPVPPRGDARHSANPPAPAPRTEPRPAATGPRRSPRRKGRPGG
ncbi:multidrug efflux pump subunit AcrA (membrane-fusion protein) [Rhodovulum iodosum]|uniref:Multidrug efflux pump subunit AcrA (Membrane-fusion protein) n=1 Tax=Rhodovulum iodosum TaxID=68291 RepID=A0ABV3XN24_9RHOB